MIDRGRAARRVLAVLLAIALLPLAHGDAAASRWLALADTHPALAADIDRAFLAGTDTLPAPSPGETPLAWLRAGLTSAARATAVMPPEATPDPVADRRLWDASRTIALYGLPAWTVPAAPSWAEDPFANPTWVFRYQSLTWLESPAMADASAGVVPDWGTVVTLLVGWIGASGNPSDFRRGPWYDHSVALRADMIVELWSRGLPDHLDDAQYGEVIHSLAQHGRVLRQFLDDPQWKGHNHGLYHAASLYNLARAFPFLAGADEWRATARARIRDALRDIVDPGEGGSLEQSFEYHQIVLDKAWRTLRWLTGTEDPPSAEEELTLSRMAAFESVIVDPLGDLPAVGDTRYGLDADTTPLMDPALSGAWTTWLLSRGTRGSPPPEALFLPATGYAILRPRHSPGAAWTTDTQVVVDAGPSVSHHGHQDALNVTFTSAGMHVLVDPGGPYIYTYPERQEFLESKVHNGIVVDGLSYDDASGRGSVTWEQAEDTSTASILTAFHDKNPDVRVTRSVILVKPDLLVILDRMIPSDHAPHTYRATFQLAPGIRRVAKDGLLYGGAGTTRFGMTFASGDAGLTSDGDGTGRVTTGPAQALLAPAVTATVHGGLAWLLTTVAPGSTPVVSWTDQGGATVARVRASGLDVDVEFTSGSGPVSVRAHVR